MITIDNFQLIDTENLFTLFEDWDKNHQFDKAVFLKSIDSVYKNSKLIIDRHDDQLVGYAQMTKNFNLGFEPFYEIVQILVSEKMRGQGIGKMIIKRIEDISISEDIRVLKLSSQVHRSKSHVFYENQGFEMHKISKFYEKRV